MNAQESINNIIERLETSIPNHESEIIRQEMIVSDLSKEYEKQVAILKAMKLELQTEKKNYADLISVTEDEKPKPKTNLIDASDDLDALLYEAADIAIKKGVFNGMVPTKNGRNQNMKSSIIVRAKNGINRYCNQESVIRFVASLTDNDIRQFRNIGEKTASVIGIARDILLGKPIECGGT